MSDYYGIKHPGSAILKQFAQKEYLRWDGKKDTYVTTVYESPITSIEFNGENHRGGKRLSVIKTADGKNHDGCILRDEWEIVIQI